MILSNPKPSNFRTLRNITVKISVRALLYLAAASMPTLSILGQPSPPATGATEISRVIPGLEPAVAKNLADGAAGLAAQRLGGNATDATALRLLQFAKALDPKNKNLLYLEALRGFNREINAATVPVKVTVPQYVAYLLSLAQKVEPSYLQLLYFNVIELLDPTQRMVIIEKHRAKENGLVTDFDGVIRRLANSFPTPPVRPKPLLAANTAKRLADGAIKLAEEQFNGAGRASKAGLTLLEFAIAIDPSNDNALFLKALLLGNHPLQPLPIEFSKDQFFTYLKEVVAGTTNDTVKLLLHHLALLKNQGDPTALVALQQAKVEGKDIAFQSLIDSLNRQTYANSPGSSTGPFNPGGTGDSTGDVKPTLDERLRNANLKDTLVSRKWTLNNLKTKEDWFFEFRLVGASTDAKGTCKGRRGNNEHSWKRWEIRNSILIIDGYVRFEFDDRRRQWVQSGGGTDMFLR